MKNKISREFKIGFFGLLIIVGLYLSINYLSSNRIFSSDKTFYAIFDSADGLEVSSPVITKGFRIGTVEQVQFNLDKQDITVKFSVEEKYPVAHGSTVKITTDGLMGGQIIELNFANESITYYQNKDTITSVFEPSIMQLASSEYTTIRTKLQYYDRKIDSLLTGLNGIVSPANVESLSSTLANLDNTTRNLNQLLEKKTKNIASIIENLDILSTEFTKVMPKLNHTMDNISAATDSLPNLMANGSKSFEEIRILLETINSSDGNLNKLINDKELYENLTVSMKNLSVLLDDIKANPKRYINVTVFEKRTFEEKMREKKAKAAYREKPRKSEK